MKLAMEIRGDFAMFLARDGEREYELDYVLMFEAPIYDVDCLFDTVSFVEGYGARDFFKLKEYERRVKGNTALVDELRKVKASKGEVLDDYAD